MLAAGEEAGCLREGGLQPAIAKREAQDRHFGHLPSLRSTRSTGRHHDVKALQTSSARNQQRALDGHLVGPDLQHLRDYWQACGKFRYASIISGPRTRNTTGCGMTDAIFGGGANCLVAASVTRLHGVICGPGRLEWLGGRAPVATIRYSIQVYDLRRGGTPPR